ncbi:MAG: hypothetical protein M1818_004157 [Claussenomyces sp. TS43310]|nr:MAG: hypothetical protein M1818_004157 [Claussenomyces sp. TS43310]
MTLANVHQDPESGPTFAVDEKSQTPSRLHLHSRRQTVHAFFHFDRMRVLRSFLSTLLIATFLTLVYASATSNLKLSHQEVDFQELLSSVPEKSLHSVLHEHVSEKYKHGVYPEDRMAIKAVHQDDAAMATSLLELARRQIGNNTATSTSAGPSTTSPVIIPTTTTSSETSTTNVQSSSTLVLPQSSSTPASPTAEATSSPSPESSTSSAIPKATVPSSSAPQTSSATSTTPGSTSTGGAKPTPESSTMHTTTDSNAAKTSVQVIYTTTLPDGARSTVTYVTIVPAGQQVQTPGVTAATGQPSLQSAAAIAMGRRPNIAAGIAMGMVGLMGIL